MPCDPLIEAETFSSSVVSKIKKPCMVLSYKLPNLADVNMAAAVMDLIASLIRLFRAESEQFVQPVLQNLCFNASVVLIAINALIQFTDSSIDCRRDEGQEEEETG